MPSLRSTHPRDVQKAAASAKNPADVGVNKIPRVKRLKDESWYREAQAAKPKAVKKPKSKGGKKPSKKKA